MQANHDSQVGRKAGLKPRPYLSDSPSKSDSQPVTFSGGSSLNRCDGNGVSFGSRPGCRPSPGGRPGAALPRVRGPLDQADRRPARSLAGDGQGVLLRPDRREGASSQGPLRRRVPRLRRRTPSRATARATPTRTARPAIPARSSAAGPASRYSTRCAPGASSTVDCRRRTTGRAPTLADAGTRRLIVWPRATGRRPASSRFCSGAGPPLARHSDVKARRGAPSGVRGA